MNKPLSTTLRLSLAGMLVTASTLVLGCGDGRPQRVPVSGTVTIDGAPLERGFVTFIPATGRSSTGDIDGEGRFSLSTYERGDGALVGTHRVEIVSIETIDERSTKWLVPKKYAKHKTSGVQVEIDQATDDVEIALTWDGGKPFIERGS